MSKKTSPTQRTLAALRADGWLAAIVEKKVPHSFVSQDLFGCIDILAIRSGEPPLGIQATSGSNSAARRSKAIALPSLRTWLSAGGCRFEVWSFRLAGPRGQRKTWALRRQAVTLQDLPPVGAEVPEGETAGAEAVASE